MKRTRPEPDSCDGADMRLSPALLRGLTQPRWPGTLSLNRRAFLGATGMAIGLAALGLPEMAQAAAWSKLSMPQWMDWWTQQKPTQKLVFANWPLYIDVTKAGAHPTLELFTKETGIAVQYLEPIQSNPEFFAKIAPLLKSGEATGYDLAVMTNDAYQFTEVLQQHWAVPLWKEKLPNVWKSASPSILNPVYDPHNTYSTVWQSGFTGIGYNPKLTRREITSVADLWDPAFKGHVGMFKNPTQYGDFGLLKLGIDPAKATPADWERAAAELLAQRKAGLVRQYYDQSCNKALESGDTWISMAWSGDIYQANTQGYKDLKFIIPKEGAMYWHDNMFIPIGAKNPLSALEWMNFYYTPKIAGLVEDDVNYVCPVPAAQAYIRDIIKDPAVADSDLVFPDEAMMAKARNYYVFKSYAEFQHDLRIFNPVVM